MKIGYTHVSTDEQKLSLQKQALKAAGCKVIIEDHGTSGASTSRLGLSEALTKIKTGDVLVVWRLDRLCQMGIPTAQCNCPYGVAVLHLD